MLNLEVLFLFFTLAIIAGWVDTVAGGGGLITIPALLLTGMSPSAALATNKLQGSAGTFAASLYFIKKKVVSLKEMKCMILLTFFGSVFGSWLLLKIDSNTLIKVLPALLIVMGIYTFFSTKISDKEKVSKVSVLFFILLICPLLGFYDGFFGPGTGGFMALSYVTLLGYGLPKATAYAKVLNLTSNISALLYFSFFGEIYWSIGITMALGQYIGASLAAKMVMEKGTILIKPVLVLVCFIMSISLIIKNHAL
jgi:uncharacterized membrane protein YfcA